MPVLTKLDKDAETGIYRQVQSLSTGTNDAAFDSVLQQDPTSGNMLLTITLRIRYRQINPDKASHPVYRAIAHALGLPPGTNMDHYPEHGGAKKLIKDWTASDWAGFRQGVINQANLWDGKFWLIPPDNFRYFEREEPSTGGGTVGVIPNVRCAFKLDFLTDGKAHAHVDVVNLEDWSFRSNNVMYDSEDVNRRPMRLPNQYNSTKSQPTVAHEIGHSLGLPHIGISNGEAQCAVGIAVELALASNGVPVLIGDAANESVCYGLANLPGDSNNIMGRGDFFTPVNAQPWLDRVLQHLDLSVADQTLVWANQKAWKVAMQPTPPRKWNKPAPSQASDSDIGTPRIQIRQNEPVLKDFELDGNILFDVGKADIKKEAEGYMHLTGSFVVQFPGNVIKFCGHTDATGSQGLNQRLSLKRAEAVMNWFRAKGYVKAGKSLAEGYGEDEPKVPNTSEANRAKNRRVVVRVYAKT